MDAKMIILVAAAMVGGAFIGAVLLLIFGRRRDGGNTAAASELAGRITQLTEMQAKTESQTAERMQRQEREITKLLDERFAGVTGRLTETLERNTKSQKSVLDNLTERLVKIDAAQKNLDELSSHVVGLQDILANKQARGAFGEVQLQNLVAAVLPAASFEWQATLTNGKRADCLLRLPNPPGNIVIDAKFPLESYRALQDAKSDEARKKAGSNFVRDVVKHIKDIEEKYIVPGETADAALMFLPSEAVYAELHANFTDQVIERSYRARVFIVSPTTLWATLNTVRAVMRDVHMKEAAGVIQAEVMTMLDDVRRLDGRVEKLQRHLEQSTEDMHQIRISTGKVTNRGEKIRDLQIEDGDADDALGNDSPGGDQTGADILPGPRPVRSTGA